MFVEAFLLFGNFTCSKRFCVFKKHVNVFTCFSKIVVAKKNVYLKIDIIYIQYIIQIIHFLLCHHNFLYEVLVTIFKAQVFQKHLLYTTAGALKKQSLFKSTNIV